MSWRRGYSRRQLFSFSSQTSARPNAMKPIHLKFISAACVAAACMLIVSRQSERPAPSLPPHGIDHRSNRARPHPSHMGDSGTTSAVPGPELPSNPQAGQSAEQEQEGLTASEVTTETAGAQDSRSTLQAGRDQTNQENGGAAGTSETSTVNKPRGIRLASNVQLPAAIMALGSPRTVDPGRSPTPVEQATRNIESSFYQDLLQASGEPTENIQNTEEEATTVIAPGREVEMARAKANEIYRALFGNEAYNRRTMESAIEVHLPENPAE